MIYLNSKLEVMDTAIYERNTLEILLMHRQYWHTRIIPPGDS